MTAVKRLFFSALNLLGGICILIGVGTPAWLTDDGGSVGIVPFYSTEVGWFAAASWMMFISLSLAVVVSLFTAMLFRDVRRHGYSYTQRSRFFLLAMFALMVTILTVVAVILIGVNLPSFNDYWYDDATLGYSAWVSVAGAVCFFVESGLALSFAFVECNCY
ncbi:uncharacterized protein CELE_F44G3.10 [Caenorhabditis elegans]|uniref:Transmembrane protein n=1 Tax=Caenorhabditis elegans TaxID=6239 RepID=O45515_CAEEL|nr:Transmembrane protein [Caenorhabditis elegans]CAB05514.1 Transmembrane protein [Caenorhabditis elegans]|eukprot:NP_507063.1 Uncharacterized protein CELE_F44G3.10 [Caenorhabditis elegans]